MESKATAKSTPIRVLLVSSLAIIRTGLRKLIEDWPGLTVIGDVANCADAVALAEQIDIILFDCDFCTTECFNHFPCTDNCGTSLPCHEDCLKPLRQLLAVAKGARVLLLTYGYNPVLYHQALRLGAMGLVLKKESAEVLLQAIKKVHAGELWLNQVMVMNMLNEMYAVTRAKETDSEAAKIATLTVRELEVVALVHEGLKNKQIAERLFISDATVHHHLTTIYDKLGVPGRSKLMIYVYQHRLTQQWRSNQLLSHE